MKQYLKVRPWWTRFDSSAFCLEDFSYEFTEQYKSLRKQLFLTVLILKYLPAMLIRLLEIHVDDACQTAWCVGKEKNYNKVVDLLRYSTQRKKVLEAKDSKWKRIKTFAHLGVWNKDKHCGCFKLIKTKYQMLIMKVKQIWNLHTFCVRKWIIATMLISKGPLN